MTSKGKSEAPFQISDSPPTSIALNPCSWLLWTLDASCWCITIVGPLKCIATLCSGSPGVKVNDGAWRAKAQKEKLITNNPDQVTTYDVLNSSFTKYADQNALGTREFLGMQSFEWTKFPLAKFGETKWKTYKEFGERVHGFGSGLVKLGLRPQAAEMNSDTLQRSTGPHTILIYEDTCADWMTAMIGAHSQSITVATSYSTLGMHSVIESLNEVHARVIVCNIKDVDKVAKACTGRCRDLEYIVYTPNNSVEKKFTARVIGPKVLSMDEVIDMGRATIPIPKAPSPEQIACVMYTSGSTGKPKGVMITHANVVASVSALQAVFLQWGLQLGKETYIAYLPAAHILELCAEIGSLSLGFAVGYADPRTISSKGACRQRPDGTINTKPEYPYPPGAIQEFKPSVMAAVPKIWDILKKGVEENVGKMSPVLKYLFQVAFSGRHWAVQQYRDSPLFKAVVLKKLKAMMGGNLKLGITGGGPIAGDVQNFIRVAFSIPLLQGYALTESTCAGTIQQKWDVRNGIVGSPVPSVELKLRSCIGKDGEAEVLDREKKPYLETDTAHYGKTCAGRGEVLIRGPSVSKGYFKQPDKMVGIFDSEGWFHSGDVGLFLPDGSLMLVDRVKNLVKLKGGEYIAIEAMEKEYTTSPYVNALGGGVMCYGDGDMDRPVALVQANAAEIVKLATSNGIPTGNIEQLCKNPTIEKLVLDNLVKAGKEGKLGSNEILGAIVLIAGTGPEKGKATVDSPWTAENECLTASNKLNRNGIKEAFQPVLKPLIKKGIK
mmetsp:Transcript_136672/g.241015  ORF Transcript_136672/g.241015 Transcript_136672/m.241015 type:complete len:777 (-) Transcript_136672:54-2384(-)